MAANAKQLRLRIITPELTKVDEDVDMVIMRATTGDMGILPGHEPRCAVLRYGIIRIFNGSQERRIAVFAGMASIERDVLTIITGGAEWPEDVDRARAQTDLEQAEMRLRERTSDIELQHDQLLFRRALVRIEVSSYAFDDEENADEPRE